MMSMRKRLLVSLLGLWVTVWGAITWVSIERSNHEVEELLDAELAQIAHVLRSIAVAGNLSEFVSSPQTLSPIGHPYEMKISFQLWDGDVLSSSFGGAPDTRLADQPGYSSQVTEGGTEWRVFGLPCGIEGNLMLYVAQDLSIRRELVQYLTLHALQPVLWSLPLAVMLIWLAVADGLRALARLARNVAARSDRQLQPIAEEDVPAEMRPLVHALNGLMAKLQQTLSIERRFAADASHELRTPLAIIRTHAQIAKRSTDNPQIRDQALDDVTRGVDRAARLVAQLLALSRLNYDSAKRESDVGSLMLTVSDVLADRYPAADAKSIRIEERFDADDLAEVSVPNTILDVLVGNLIDNAIKFTPSGGLVVVEIQPSSETVRLTISDSGPGIPVEDREQVFERFFRHSGQEEPGAGLGLSIVKRICDLHGGTIMLGDASAVIARNKTSSAGPGLRVDLVLPRQPGRSMKRRRLLLPTTVPGLARKKLSPQPK